jgi:mRNA (2'-O-methyladenosine-N6-)-methyltransferase
MDLKADLMDNASHPPLYLPLLDPDSGPPRPTPTSIQAAVSTNRFDAILITPPQPLDWSYIASLPLRNISADPGFVFLWVGNASGDGLERGRECFAKWGFRRAEDIVWVKTNKNAAKREEGRDEGGLFAGQKEHCLMGIRGTVRRSTDSRFVHCNVDTDVMVWEDEEGESLSHFRMG